MKFTIKAVFTVIFSVLFLTSITAQDKTYSFGKKGFSESLPKVAIIPFEDKLFLSDINKEVAKRTGLDIQEIENTFRDGMIQSIVNLGSGSYNFLDPTDMEQEDLQQLIGGIYSCVSYDYILVVPLAKEDKTKAKKILENLEKKENPNQKNRGAYLEDGQIKEWYDRKERYMDATIRDQEKFDKIVAENELDFVLLINELDIKVMRDVNRDVGQTWPRRIKIHFTIFDKAGKKTFGSAVYQTYDGQQKDIYNIIRKNFRPPCSQIVAKLGTALPQESTATNSTQQSEKHKDKNSKTKRAKRVVTQENGDDDF